MSDLPPGWAWTTLGEIGDVVSGSTPRTTVPEYWGGEIAWITPDDLSGYTSKYIERGARNISQAGYDTCSTTLMPAGAVLFSSRAPIGYVAIAREPVCTNQGFKSFIPSDAVTSDYLYWYLRHATPAIRATGSGTTFAEVSKKRLQPFVLPLAPLNEQRRIVAAIEEHLSRLDAADASLAIAKQRSQLFRVSVLEAAFTNGSTRRAVGAIASLADGPFGSNLKTSHYVAEGPRVVRLQNIGDGVFRDERAHITAEHFAALIKHAVVPGDVIVASLGEEAPRACPVPDWLGDAIVKADCIRLRPHDGVDPSYVMWALNSRPVKAQAAARIKGIGRPRLGLGGIRELEIPLPPLEEQRRIVAEVEERLSRIDAMRASIERAQRRSASLRAAILERAFRGELVPQDPADEPAETLLARIRAERDMPEPATGRRRKTVRP